MIPHYYWINTWRRGLWWTPRWLRGFRPPATVLGGVKQKTRLTGQHEPRTPRCAGVRGTDRKVAEARSELLGCVAGWPAAAGRYVLGSIVELRIQVAARVYPARSFAFCAVFTIHLQERTALGQAAETLPSARNDTHTEMSTSAGGHRCLNVGCLCSGSEQ